MQKDILVQILFLVNVIRFRFSLCFCRVKMLLPFEVPTLQYTFDALCSQVVWYIVLLLKSYRHALNHLRGLCTPEQHYTYRFGTQACRLSLPASCGKLDYFTRTCQVIDFDNRKINCFGSLQQFQQSGQVYHTLLLLTHCSTPTIYTEISLENSDNMK